MAGTDHGASIARVYAEAVLRLAEAQADMDVVLAELEQLGRLIETDAGLREYLASPTVDAASRQQAIERLLRGRYTDLTVDALQVLNRKSRLGLVPLVASAFRHAKDERQGRVEVKVTTAVPLADDLRTKLKEAAATHTGKEPELVETVDERVIGGLIVQIEDQKFDDSVLRQLHKLIIALRDRASHEIHGGRTYWAGSASIPGS